MLLRFGCVTTMPHDSCRDCGDEPCTRPCQICQRHRHNVTDLQTCFDCATEVRRDLQRTVDLYALLPEHLGHPSAIRLDQRRGSGEPALPGGDPLVLLGPGADAGNRRRAYLAGLDDAWDQDDRLSDPVSVAFTLASWEDTWRKMRREPAATDRGTVTSASAYLHRWHDWAAQQDPDSPQSPDFYGYAHELGKLRRHLERVTRTGDQPERVNATCLDCGERLQRKMTDEGFSDDAHCPACGRIYGPREYLLAVRAFLQQRVDAREAS